MDALDPMVVLGRGFPRFPNPKPAPSGRLKGRAWTNEPAQTGANWCVAGKRTVRQSEVGRGQTK